MSLLDVEPYLFVRLVKLARLALRFHFTDHLRENFHRFEAAFALVTLDMHLDAAVGSDCDFKFALGHKFKRLKSKGRRLKATRALRLGIGFCLFSSYFSLQHLAFLSLIRPNAGPSVGLSGLR